MAVSCRICGDSGARGYLEENGESGGYTAPESPRQDTESLAGDSWSSEMPKGRERVGHESDK